MGRSNLEWMTGQRDQFKTDLQTAQTNLEQSSKELSRLSGVAVAATATARQAVTDADTSRRKAAELDASLQSANREVIAKTQQIDSLTPEIANLRRQIASAKPAAPARPVKIEEEARPIVTALYRGGNMQFGPLKKELEMADGSVRHHILGLHRLGLVDYTTLIGSDDVYTVKLSSAGLRYARDNALE